MTNISDNVNVSKLKISLSPISEIVQGLKKKTANELAGPCPFCGGEDRFIVFLDSGRFMCRQCSPKGGDVIDFHCKAEGLDIKGLAEKYLDERPGRGKQTETGRYYYQDAAGKELYYKIRLEPGRDGRAKDFIFYHGNATGRGCDPVLYNLPAVIKADTVYITEGEKHADILTAWGLYGTSLDSGSNSKLIQSMIDCLTGKNIVILPDNDSPGRIYRDMLLKGLQGKAASIKVIDLPGLPEKGDIVNWAKAGHGKEELLDLVNSAPEWEPEAGADVVLNEQPDGGDDFIIKEWPVLNPKALYGLTGTAVELATRYSEADPAAVLFQFLAFFGAKCGAGVKFFVGDTVHYPRLNVAVIGNSSKARKGTSAQPVKKFFKSETDVVRVSPGPLSSGEGIIDAVRDEVKEWQCTDKKEQQYGWVTIDPGIEDKRLIILDEELASALASMKRDGNKLSTIIRCMWDSGTCAPLTKTAKTKCTDTHIVLVTHSTFSELKAKLEDNEYVNGFGNRFLWVMARRQKLVSRPLPMPEDEVETVRAGIEKAFRYSKNTSRLYFDDESWSLWDKVYPDLTRDHPGYSGAIVNRGEAQVIRLSMIYALMDCSDKIRPVHLEAALAAWAYCRESALYIFGDREEDSLTQRIIDILEDGPMTATEIYNSLNRHIKSKYIKSSLDDLIARGRVQVEQERTEGRTKTIFTISVCAKSAKSVLSPDPLNLNALNTLNAPTHKKNINRNLYPNQSSEVDYVEL